MNTSTYKTQPDIPANITPQKQASQPGKQSEMNPLPVTDNPNSHGCGRLNGRVVLITGGDSGIGEAVAIACAKEGADIAIVYLMENQDAQKAKASVEAHDRRCLLIRQDLRTEQGAVDAVKKVMAEFGSISVLINNIAVQYPQNSLLDITAHQLEDTFATNVFSAFYMTKAALPHFQQGASIINTASVTFYGSETLIDYSATKGALVSFTRSMALNLSKLGIRVNAVAPGPTWTPLIPASFSPEKVGEFGKDVPLGRPAQPFELAPAYVYLASDDSAYMSGQVLHVNGGKIMAS